MVNTILLTKLSISLFFLSLATGHPTPECPCKCGSPYGSHPVVITKQETVPVTEVIRAPQGPSGFYTTYLQPPQPVRPEPVSQNYELTFIPTSVMKHNEPAPLIEPFPVSVEMPMPTAFAQSRTIETSMPPPQIEVSSSAPCHSDGLTGRTLEFYVEAPVVSAQPEIQYETYNTGIQEVIQEPMKPMMRSFEQLSAPVVAQPKPTYVMSEPAPARPPVYQFFRRIAAPEVQEAPILPPPRTSCKCFQQ